MNKFIKIIFMAFFAFSLAACDTDAQGMADFKKMLEWQQPQEKTLADAQTELQQKVASGDKVQIEEGLTAFTNKINTVLSSLDALEIKHSAINELKTKTKQTLVLSNELILESVKVIASPTADAQKLIQNKSQALLQAGQELQQLQLQLQQKFGADAAK